MRATVIHASHDVRVEEVPDPVICRPTDAVVRVVLSCICGTDLWAYRGVADFEPGQRTSHEFVGVVEDVGADVVGCAVGDLVVVPFVWSDGECGYCAEGLTTSCERGGFWGTRGSDGGQGEAVRVPYADGTLVRLPDEAASDRRQAGTHRHHRLRNRPALLTDPHQEHQDARLSQAQAGAIHLVAEGLELADEVAGLAGGVEMALVPVVAELLKGGDTVVDQLPGLPSPMLSVSLTNTAGLRVLWLLPHGSRTAGTPLRGTP